MRVLFLPPSDVYAGAEDEDVKLIEGEGISKKDLTSLKVGKCFNVDTMWSNICDDK